LKIVFFWFRRDVRLEDNIALNKALDTGYRVQPLFIFDSNIIDELDDQDPRVSFIYSNLEKINSQLQQYGSSLLVKKGDPLTVWKEIISDYNIESVYFNHDYEPYAIARDKKITDLLRSKEIHAKSFKDQVIFEKDEVIKADGTPYTVFTPYKNKWLQAFTQNTDPVKKNQNTESLNPGKFRFPDLKELGFRNSHIKVKPYDLDHLAEYDKSRDIPHLDSGSNLGPHLRFGTISIRKVVDLALKANSTFLSELIWREFFMQILFHFPSVINSNFKSKYDGVIWRNDADEFNKWCLGRTGYPLVDAGMRQLNKTGYMHNRVRMIAAGFLCKHLLIDWKWGESYFASKLLDYELSSNNGNWQWSAGTGCDAAPYFRIFNPSEQLKKFDKELIYIKRWVPEYDTPDYSPPIIDHKFARARALDTYKSGLKKYS